MLKRTAIAAIAVCAALSSSAQSDSIYTKDLKKPVSITYIVRAIDTTPMTFSNISAEDIKKINYGQDVPFLLRDVPSLVSTSDAGTGIGYTGLWIRGSDPSRINVTINDIPLNDPESQQVFWVNLPDFATSTSNIQVQRGIGSSTNGVASFGGSIRMETKTTQYTPYTNLYNGAGSFNTLRNSVSFGTGMLNEKFMLEGRLSRIASDGYIDRANARLHSFYLASSFFTKKAIIKATVFGGNEKTYQSWYGTPVSRLINNTDSMMTFAANNGLNEEQTNNLLTSGRTYNYYTYRNQVDDYSQTHAQLHIQGPFIPRVNFTGALHYTKGRGYFEEFKYDQDYESYNLQAPNENTPKTDLVRRRWLDNHFFGGLFNFKYVKSKLVLDWGGAANQYIGDHFGEIIWLQNGGYIDLGDKYYKGESLKTDMNTFVKGTYTNKKLTFYGDLQVRYVDYSTSGTDNDLRAYKVDTAMTFFNPKVGMLYMINDQKKLYASVAVGNKEPNRNDFVDAAEGKTPKAESMTDVEFGYIYQTENLRINANGYYMNYKNQLVLTGELNDVGAPLRTNVDKSFRRGVEFDIAHQIFKTFSYGANLSLSQNKISSFNEVLYDYTVDFDVLNIEHKKTTIAFSPSIIAGARVEWNCVKNLFVTLYGRHVGKQYLDNTESEYLTIDPYTLFDAGIRYEVPLKNSKKISVNGMLNNALNKQYSSNGYTYSYIYGSRVTEKFYYPQAGRFFLVSLSLEL
jgi:iron complex outermembrane recepter protein